MLTNIPVYSTQHIWRFPEIGLPHMNDLDWKIRLKWMMTVGLIYFGKPAFHGTMPGKWGFVAGRMLGTWRFQPFLGTSYRNGGFNHFLVCSYSAYRLSIYWKFNEDNHGMSIGISVGYEWDIISNCTSMYITIFGGLYISHLFGVLIHIYIYTYIYSGFIGIIYCKPSMRTWILA